MKKTILIYVIFIVVALLLAGGILFINQSRAASYITSQMFCAITGGKVFQHSFSSNCERKAKDAGKKCIYDNECSKNQCVYPVPSECTDRWYCKPTSSAVGTGRCDAYTGDSDGILECHRKKGENVKCYLNVS